MHTPRTGATAFFTVQVVGIRGIANSDWIGGPCTGGVECYIDILCGGKLMGTTDVIADSLQPMWTEEFDVREYKEGDKLEFIVYTKEHVLADRLGAVTIQPADFAADGFNNEHLMEDTSANMKAYLSVKIKPKGKPYPAGPPVTLTVDVEKGNNKDYGMLLDYSDGQNLIIYGFRPGAFAEYTKRAKPSRQLRKSDFVVSVNKASDFRDRLTQFKESKVTCVVTRGIEVSVTLERTNVQKPLGLAFPEEIKTNGFGLPITSVSVNEGAAKEYNDNCTRDWDKIQAYDRIVSVGDETGQPLVLKEKLEKTSGKFQIRILRARPQEMMEPHHKPLKFAPNWEQQFESLDV